MKTRYLLITLLFFCACLYSQVTGDYRSLKSGNWSDRKNWQRYNGSVWVVPNGSLGYPAQKTIPLNVTVQHNIVLDVSPQYNIFNLNINNNDTLLLNPNINIKVLYKITDNGFLILDADSTGYSQIIQTLNTTNSGSGTVIIKHYVKKLEGYKLYGAPATINFSDITFNNGFSWKDCKKIYYFDTWSGKFISTDTVNTVFNGRGFFIYFYESDLPLLMTLITTIDKLGTGNLTDSIIRANVPWNGNKYGWNLITNRYPSNIDHDLQSNQLINNGCTGVIWVWNGYNYIARNAVGGGNPDARYIAPFQAFWVYDSTNVKGTYTLTNNIRTLNKGSVLLKSAEIKDIIKINISDKKYTDISYIYLDWSSNNNYNSGKDCQKLFSPISDVPQTYINNVLNKPFNVKYLSYDSLNIVPIGLKYNGTDSLTLTIDLYEYSQYYSIYLYDSKYNTILKIANEHSLTFLKETNENLSNRFYLMFNYKELIVEKVYKEETIIYNRLCVYNTVGYKLIDYQNDYIKEEEIKEKISSLDTGIYIIKLSNKTLLKTYKIIKE